jgi:hypothetical protein
MRNPDVIQGEEIASWTWIAAVTLIAVLVAAVVLGTRSTQVAGIGPNDVPPPIARTIPAL